MVSLHAVQAGLWLFLGCGAVCQAGNASEKTVRRHARHQGLVDVAVSSQGALLLDGTGGAHGGTSAPSEDVVTDPTFAESAGKWKVHYDGWSSNHPWKEVEIFCDGKYKIWNGHLSKLSTSDSDKKELCSKGTAKDKIQWVSKNWNGDKNKWECGWYDSDADKIHVYHYVKGSKTVKEGHKVGDNYWGMIHRSKREAEVNCPTTAPAEKSGAAVFPPGVSVSFFVAIHMMTLY